MVTSRASVAAVFAVALALRLAYWSWAPRVLTGDDFFYDAYARGLLAGHGYVELDGSPAAFWMPGWPLLLAGFYGLFGAQPQLGMLMNVLLGAATAALVAVLGGLLAGRRIGVLAGMLYALWPGTLYFSGSLMSEPAFGFFLALSLVTLAAAARCAEGPARAAGALAAGAGLGACALVKAEPLVLLPVFAVALLAGRASGRTWLRDLGLLGLGCAVLMAPWVVRNRLVFDRWIVSSVSGGANFWIGNHPGGGGGNDFAFERRFREENPGATLAESNLLQDAEGWRRGLRFVREQPFAALALVPRKLALSYGSDHAGAANLGGTGALRAFRIDVPRGRRVAPETRERLNRLADAWWFGVLGLAAFGLLALPGWRPPARAIVLGVLGAWLAVHAVFLGGPRFHAPECVVLAVLAAAGLVGIVERGGRLLRPGAGAA